MNAPERLADELAACAVFSRLTSAQLVTVAGAAREFDLAPGTVLFREGQPASGCWLIRTGQLALETATPNRGPIVIQTLGRGDLAGWSWLVPPHRWHFDARAATAVTALEFDTDQLRASAEEDPALGYPLALGLMETLLARLQSTRVRLLDLYGNPRADRA